MHEDVIHWTIQSQTYTKNICMQAMVVTPIPVSNHMIKIFISFLGPHLKNSVLAIKAKQTFTSFEISNMVEKHFSAHEYRNWFNTLHVTQ